MSLDATCPRLLAPMSWPLVGNGGTERGCTKSTVPGRSAKCTLCRSPGPGLGGLCHRLATAAAGLRAVPAPSKSDGHRRPVCRLPVSALRAGTHLSAPAGSGTARSMGCNWLLGTCSGMQALQLEGGTPARLSARGTAGSARHRQFFLVFFFFFLPREPNPPGGPGALPRPLELTFPLHLRRPRPLVCLVAFPLSLQQCVPAVVGESRETLLAGPVARPSRPILGREPRMLQSRFQTSKQANLVPLSHGLAVSFQPARWLSPEPGVWGSCSRSPPSMRTALVLKYSDG